jgi:hypothetical protein
MDEYRALLASELTADPERATRQCGRCGKLYIVPDNVCNYQCLCGSRTLYSTVGGNVSAIPWSPEVEAASRYKP